MSLLKILRVKYNNISLYDNNEFEVDFTALDRVADKDQVYVVNNKIYTQKVITFIGINATGKTTTLKLINFILEILINERSLNSEGLTGKIYIENNTKITVNFVYKNKIYEWIAIIGKNSLNKLYFEEEFIKEKSMSSIKSKKDIYNFSFIEKSFIRSDLKDVLKYLKAEDSIIKGFIGEVENDVYELMPYTDANLFLVPNEKIPTEFINAFDSSIEMFNCKHESGIQYELKFKGADNFIKVNNPFELCNVISSGTIKGQNIMFRIAKALEMGGYIIIDELENHFNKEIVKTIIDIFKNPKINPRGACLIFSTHYAEILDSIDRKDNIYITRKNNLYRIEVLNYSTQKIRSDLKKSDVILSDIINGTAPQYENLQKLKGYLCQSI